MSWNRQTIKGGKKEQIDPILQFGGTSQQHYNHSIRTIEWLEQHGQCMDHIKSGISTIPHAGYGAFANRRIPKDSLVAPVPLIHIPNKDIFLMYDAPSRIQKITQYC